MRLPTILLALLLAGCASTPTAPTCDESAYRSLNPAHYEPVKEDPHADVPILIPDA